MPSKKEPQNDSFIVVKGAKEHNLKNLNVSIPRDSLTVITGLSGSGKSSLAFDTIFAEGQRRYVESLSTYARQFLEVLDKPEVESIDGLSPTISIQQKTSSHNPRSTVGTVTEVYDYMRLLYARVSMPYCYSCNKPIASQTAQQMAEQVLSYPEGSKINLLSPMVRGRKGEYQKELNAIRQKGFSKVRIDGEVMDLSQTITLDKQKKHDIDVYVDRLVLRTSPGSSSSAFSKASLRARILESIETALKLSEGLVKIVVEGSAQSKSLEPELLLSEKFACGDCGISYPQPEPRTFSFNSPMGACKTCEGIGFFSEELDKTAEDSEETSSLTVYTACAECKGARLKAESLFFKIEKKNIAELSSLSISRLRDFFKKIDLTKRQLLIADRILKEIRDRLDFLVHVGVEYLSLDRSAQTLSGGESQRIRLATQIGSSLTGVTYILDEPSIGLHQRDNDKLLETLVKLRDNGNTLLVVEHDKDTMEKADFILDLGPGAGMHGGHIVAQGSLSDILKNKDSLTSKYLTGEQKIEVPRKRRSFDKKIQINGVTHHNLEEVNAFIPLGVFTCVTGVSGSGKSTLVLDTLYPYLMHQLFNSKKPPVQLRSITGAELIDKVIDIDQSPIGRTPRSNPATYTGTFSFIRELFAQLPESRMRGFKSGRFSFNVKGGRCEKCQGAGLAKVEMHFLSDIYVACDACDRKRFNDETLSIKYRGKSISDVLDMTIEEAATFFENVPSLFQKLKTLSEVGLSYITLGQSATTLSGGEAQRMKLAKELSRRATGKTLYILDEPSTGLHFDDIRKLLALLHRLVEQGNTVVVIEHNLEIIKTADYIIDMGPEGGELGGKLIASGTPEEVANVKGSYTGKYLKPYLR